MEMQAPLQYLIGAMYPHILYKNYTGVTPNSSLQYCKENTAPCFSLQLSEYIVDMREDGIHLSTGKKELFCIQARQVKTVVRVDIFKSYEKYYPHHLPTLFISSMSEETLAANAPKGMFGMNMEHFPNRQAVLAQAHSTNLTYHWRARNKDSCPVYLTEKNVNRIRSLYPHARWIDLSDSWIRDREPEHKEKCT